MHTHRHTYIHTTSSPSTVAISSTTSAVATGARAAGATSTKATEAATIDARKKRKMEISVRFSLMFSYANKHCSMTVSYALRVNETVYASLLPYGMNSDTFIWYVCNYFRIFTKTSRVPDGTGHCSLRGTGVWNRPKTILCVC